MGLAALLLLGSPLTAAAAPPRPLVFGVLPLQSPVLLAHMFIPLCRRLSRVLQRPVVFATAPDFTRFTKRARHGRYDLIFTNPYLYRQTTGYRAVARIKGLPFVGLLITRRGTGRVPLRVAALRGRSIAFPDPRAFAATLMVERYLRARGIVVARDMRPVYLRTQDSVILAVARGLVDYGGTWPWSLAHTPADIRTRIAVVARTAAEPEMPVAVRSDLPAPLAQRIAAALIALKEDRPGRRVLRGLGIPEGFVAARPSDYAHIPNYANAPAGKGPEPRVP